jgi:hypothetical protein
MKIYWITLLIILSLANSCVAQPAVNDEIVSYLKKKKFQLELFELAMCKEEMLAILEKDTLFREIWKERAALIFDKRLSEAYLFFHTHEARLFSSLLDSSTDLKKKYPLAFELVKTSIKTKNTLKVPTDYSNLFLDYVEYPEDVDPACLVALMCFEDKAFSDINSNKVSLSRFNEWLNYGFEEFRHYSGSKSKAKNEINNRLVDFIIEKHKSSRDSLLIDKSIKLLKTKR